MECPDCGSEKVKEEQVTEWRPYGDIEKAYQATFPAMTCECGFSWCDYRAEEAKEKAMYEWLNWEPPFTRSDEEALLSEADYYEGKLRG